MRKADRLVVSCEHATKRVPVPYRTLFRGMEKVLSSHLGWDPGTLELGRRIACRYQAPLIASTATRLLVDCNRSVGHPGLFSKATRSLDEPTRGAIVDGYHRAHRERVESFVREAVGAHSCVLHVAVHSFTPKLRGIVRRCDVGLLYDPRRMWEREIVRAWRNALRRLDPSVRVWLNYPYRGWTDGLTTCLRTRIRVGRYAGIELEVNQRIVRGGAPRWLRLQHALVESLSCVLALESR